MRTLLILFLTLILTSCTVLNHLPFGGDNDLSLGNYQYYSTDDYVDHMTSLYQSYLYNSDITQVSLDKNSINYLNSLMNRIIKNNELLFNSQLKGNIVIIYHLSPFHFSLPGRKIFLSLGLLQKYVKHEGLLASIMTFELIRSNRFLYRKQIIIPTGQISTERMISLTKISLQNKLEINKWAYHSLRRTGFDASTYLSWIQTQNKNSLDFALHLGNLKQISKEESLFKSFIVKNGLGSLNTTGLEANSSREFYKFIHYLKKYKL